MTATKVEAPVLQFVEPLPGFGSMEKFALISLDEELLLFEMVSVDDQAIRFVVLPPMTFFPDYAPEIRDEVAASLGITDAEDALILVIVNVGASLAESTANLLAPVIINRHSLRAVQVILDGSQYPLKAALVPNA